MQKFVRPFVLPVLGKDLLERAKDGKGVVSFPAFQVAAIEKGAFGLPLTVVTISFALMG